MGAVYGVGLLGQLPQMSTEEEVAALTQFAEMCGLKVPFREVVSGRVGEWQPPAAPGEGYTVRWLEAEEAAPIIAFAQNQHRSAPYSQFTFLDGWQVFIPGPEHPQNPIWLPVPGHEPVELWCNTFDEGLAEIERINRRIESHEPEFWEGMRFTCEEYVEFHNSLRDAMQGCIRHSLIYFI